MKALLVAFLIVALPALAEERENLSDSTILGPESPSGRVTLSTESDQTASPDYVRGWCDAAKTVWENRNHNQALIGYGPETQEAAMARIEKKWPPDPPPLMKGKVPTAGGKPLLDKTATDPVAGAVNSELAAIDLYVVLPQCIEGKQP